MSGKIENMSPRTGRQYKEDSSVVNTAEMIESLGGAFGELDAAAQADPSKAASAIALLKGILTDLGQTSDATVTAGAVGSLSAKIRRLTTDIDTLLTKVGEVQATPTANTILARVKALETELLAIKSTAGIKKITDPLPAGTNNIGDVDLASAIPAGTNNIGKVQLTDGTNDSVILANGKVPVDLTLTGDTSLAANVAIQDGTNAARKLSVDATGAAAVKLTGSNVEIGGVSFAVSGGDTLRNTAANKPNADAAHAVIPFCYYHAIDTGTVEATDGTNWVVI